MKREFFPYSSILIDQATKTRVILKCVFPQFGTFIGLKVRLIKYQDQFLVKKADKSLLLNRKSQDSTETCTVLEQREVPPCEIASAKKGKHRLKIQKCCILLSKEVHSQKAEKCIKIPKSIFQFS